MTIERNGEKIELTREEIRLAGKENDREYLKEDIRCQWAFRHDGKECPYSDEELEEVACLAFDFYCMCIDNVIDSFVEGGSV